MADPRTEFAAVLAQVIPVAVLAVVVEAKTTHRGVTATAEAALAAGRPIQVDPSLAKSLKFQTGVLVFLVLLELAALLTAAGEAGPVVSWFAGPPGAIGAGVLLVLVGRLHIDSVSEAYERVGLLLPDAGQSVRWWTCRIFWGSVITGCLAVGLCWMPWWDLRS